jgi:uncharacterized protein YpmB
MRNSYSFNNEHFMHIIIIILLFVIIVMLYMYHSKRNTYENFAIAKKFRKPARKK